MPAVYTGTCACCQCSPLLLECRRRAGLITLCGLPEYDSPSMPPRYYKVESITGTMTTTRSPNADCNPTACPGTITFNGLAVDSAGDLMTYTGKLAPNGTMVGPLVQYVASGITMAKVAGGGLKNGYIFIAGVGRLSNGQTFNLSNLGSYTVQMQDEPLVLTFYTLESQCMIVGNNTDDTVDTWNRVTTYALPACTPGTVESGTSLKNGVSQTFPSAAPALVYGSLVDVSYTQTTTTLTGKNVCVPDPLNFGSYIKCDGTVTMSLTSEDTEEAAITRFQSATPFGAYQTPGLLCPNPPCCLAQWEERISGPSFVYADVQYKAQQGGFGHPNDRYTVLAKLYRRIFGVGEFVFFQSMMTDVISDGTGDVSTDDTDVPNERGYETYVSAACARYNPS